jgi:hypothetical protein
MNWNPETSDHLEGMGEDELAEMAQLDAESGDDGDAATKAWSTVLCALPQSDILLDGLIRAGSEDAGYFCEKAFLDPATKTSDAERRALLLALHQLAAFNQIAEIGSRDRALDVLRELDSLRQLAPNLSILHFRQAEGQLKTIVTLWHFLTESEWEALELAMIG